MELAENERAAFNWLMPPNLEEQLGLHVSYSQRPGTPLIEAASSSMIEVGFRELIEERYLYQKVEVNLEAAAQIVAPTLEQKHIPPPASRQRLDYGLSSEKAAWNREIPTYLKSLCDEMEKRVWAPVTRHKGDNPKLAEVQSYANFGANPLGSTNEDRPVRFFLPNIQIKCGGACKKKTFFTAHLSSTIFRGLEQLHPRSGPHGTEQIFQPIYRCEICRTMIYTFLVRRVGRRLHLCGVAPRRAPEATRAVPEPLIPILADAEQAVAENDLFAGFYHLRTLVEHYLKSKLTVPLKDQLRGEDLVSEYHETLPTQWRSLLPSLGDAYSKLSANMHARSGDVEGFAALKEQVCNHLDMLAILERQGRPHETGSSSK